MQSRKIDNRLYIVGDIISSFLAGLLALTAGIFSSFSDLISAVVTYPFILLVYVISWLVFYAIFDSYKDIYRQSRITVIVKTFALGLVGILGLYILMSQGIIAIPYFPFWKLLILHIIITLISRMLILTHASKKLKQGLIGFNTIIVGTFEKALALHQDLQNQISKTGHQIVGFISFDQPKDSSRDLPHLGTFDEVHQVIEKYNIEEAVLALEKKDSEGLKNVLNVLFEFKDRVLIKVVPDLYDILLGSVKMNHVYGAVLIEISQELMPKWQKIVKRFMDIIVSGVALIILSPVLLYAAIRVKFSSPGSILYSQERIGFRGRPFDIYKFRSMYMDAEDDGPTLSDTDDPRCTQWGSTMRKWRIDELPQFWNVLLGEMSLVGPRPERAYYIDLITQRAPHYKHLLKVKPGITSWGQVKYGYASDVDQMIKRLQFDILYIENMSLTLDFKIFAYTILVLIQGKGK